MNKKVRVKGISRKMRNKVKEHGDVWDLVATLDGEACISTVKVVHGGVHPYVTWVKLGEDAEISEVTDVP